MALTDTFVKNAKPDAGKAAGTKHTDGQGLYLLVKPAGKYWRMDYRYADKRKTLALGVYPAVSLAQARKARDKARALLAQDIDPGVTRRVEKAIAKTAAGTVPRTCGLFFFPSEAPARSVRRPEPSCTRASQPG